ncbi:HAD-IIA family hydrolase [Serinicoccus kebangsaanensis]|uniref:HAD-IIA family hydrolase n=1 Tax=Serinicoccus kebangsaanensis TaxID=2602069 RepID=UPI00124ED911|nr:HAD-IIA family hydrolase [Serinicoccus kebangsaanensis]
MIEGMLCDLDGVVYRAHEPCDGAVEGLARARAAGVRVLFMTNNASRSPEDVAAQLTDLGVPADPQDVLTASEVAAEELASTRPDLLASGAVLAVGGPGVAAALQAAGFHVLVPPDLADADRRAGVPPIGAVVQGYGPRVGVADLAEAAYAITAGALWVATNDDPTLPTERGQAPGNGSLVMAVAHATGASPVVVGKPHRPAYDVALRRLGLPPEATLMVGDRLDTDIAGARAAGLRSALVLTGVSTRAEADAAPHEQRPDRVADTILDLSDLWRAA